jgi:hypothetical protein
VAVASFIFSCALSTNALKRLSKIQRSTVRFTTRKQRNSKKIARMLRQAFLSAHPPPSHDMRISIAKSFTSTLVLHVLRERRRGLKICKSTWIVMFFAQICNSSSVLPNNVSIAYSMHYVLYYCCIRKQRGTVVL